MNAPSQRKFQLGYKWYQHDFQVFKFSWTQTEKVPWSHCVSNTLSSTRRQHGKWMPGCRLFFHMMMGISFHTCIMCIGARSEKKTCIWWRPVILQPFLGQSCWASHIYLHLQITLTVSTFEYHPTAPVRLQKQRPLQTVTTCYYWNKSCPTWFWGCLVPKIYIYITIHNICH